MAKTQDKVIITCAVTGAIHTPTMSSYLPLTPDQIAEQAIEAAQAGAAILHLHARNPSDGQPTPDPAIFDQFVPRIAAATDAVINITTGGSTRMTMEERLAYPLQAKPEMCSLNMNTQITIAQRRPILSASAPSPIAPNIMPNSAELAMKPAVAASTFIAFMIDGSAVPATARS